MKLRVTLAFGAYRVGDLIDPPAMRAGELLAMRCMGRVFVERVLPPVPVAMATVVEPAAEPEQEPPQSRRKRRDFS